MARYADQPSSYNDWDDDEDDDTLFSSDDSDEDEEDEDLEDETASYGRTPRYGNSFSRDYNRNPSGFDRDRDFPGSAESTRWSSDEDDIEDEDEGYDDTESGWRNKEINANDYDDEMRYGRSGLINKDYSVERSGRNRDYNEPNYNEFGRTSEDYRRSSKRDWNDRNVGRRARGYDADNDFDRSLTSDYYGNSPFKRDTAPNRSSRDSGFRGSDYDSLDYGNTGFNRRSGSTSNYGAGTKYSSDWEGNKDRVRLRRRPSGNYDY